MKAHEFIARLDESRLVAAIAEAERKSSGEIRVYVSHQERNDVMAAAEKRFASLGMTKTRRRSGVLIYFVPRSRKFAILGDVGIHERCGDNLWQEISGAMTAHLKRGEFTEAILLAIGRVGAVLAEHFPPERDDRNELPNQIAGD